MITGSWFLDNIKGVSDLKKIDYDEYIQLHNLCTKFITNNFYALYDWNKNIANYLREVYYNTLKKMEMIEHDANNA